MEYSKRKVAKIEKSFIWVREKISQFDRDFDFIYLPVLIAKESLDKRKIQSRE